jgi:hypothetical protein
LILNYNYHTKSESYANFFGFHLGAKVNQPGIILTYDWYESSFYSMITCSKRSSAKTWMVILLLILLSYIMKERYSKVSTSFIAQETWLGNNISWFSQVFEYPSRRVSLCLRLPNVWETWLRNNVSWFIFRA